MTCQNACWGEKEAFSKYFTVHYFPLRYGGVDGVSFFSSVGSKTHVRIHIKKVVIWDIGRHKLIGEYYRLTAAVIFLQSFSF